jgi:hypothetical protein
MVGSSLALYFRKQLVLNVALAPDRERRNDHLPSIRPENINKTTAKYIGKTHFTT